MKFLHESVWKTHMMSEKKYSNILNNLFFFQVSNWCTGFGRKLSRLFGGQDSDRFAKRHRQF